MEELIKALKFIKETCENNDCRSCPLGLGNECLVTNENPEGWNIQEEPIQKVIL